LHRGAPLEDKTPGKRRIFNDTRTVRPFISLASALVCALIANAAQAQGAAAPPLLAAKVAARAGEIDLAPVRDRGLREIRKQLPVDKLKVPDGFKVEVWAEGLPGRARCTRQ